MAGEKYTLGAWATLAEEKLGTWGGYTARRIPLLSRRTFLLGSAAGGFSLALEKLRWRLVENALTPRELSPDELTEAVKQAATFPKQEWGIFPDFEKPGADVWGVPDEARERIGENFVGFFALLEDIDDPSRMEEKRDIMNTIIRRGSRPVVSLGTAGAGLDGHPFDPVNDQQMQKWIKKWADFLNSFDIEIDVRFLFEMNLDHGHVAYIDDGRLSHDLHVNRFKDLFDALYRQLGSHSKVRLAFCPTSAGVHTMEYVPTRGAKTVGVNLFDFTEGKDGIGWYNLIRGLAYMEGEVNTAYVDLKQASHRSGDVPMYIYEIGSLTHEAEWLKKIAAQFFAKGGRGIGYFNYDKAYTGRSTETDWTLRKEELNVFAGLFQRIDAQRKKLQRLRHFLLD